jgi:hypothetical protein
VGTKIFIKEKFKSPFKRPLPQKPSDTGMVSKI